MTTEEMLAAYINNAGETLMHFNEKHDAKGRFAKKNGGSSGSSSSSGTKKAPTGAYTGPNGPIPFSLNVTKEEAAGGIIHAKETFSDHCFGLSVNDIDAAYASCENDEEIQTASDNIGAAFISSIRPLVRNYVLGSSAYAALQDGEYHSEREYLQGSNRLADQVYMDLQIMFSNSEVMSQYLKSPEAKKTVAEVVGKELGMLFSSQEKPSEKLGQQKREKNVTEGGKGIQKRATVTLEQLRKENPNIPDAALNEMLKGKENLEKNKKKKNMRGGTSVPGTVKHDAIDDEYLMHFNPNHDPRNGQFARSAGAGISAAASNKKAQIKNAAIRAKRVPERIAKIKRIGAFTAAGAVAGASVALGLMSGGFGAMPIALLASSAAAKTGAGLMGAYMGGMLGATAGVGKEAISDYLKGKGADAEDWDRYIRSNTDYDRLL